MRLKEGLSMLVQGWMPRRFFVVHESCSVSSIVVEPEKEYQHLSLVPVARRGRRSP